MKSNYFKIFLMVGVVSGFQEKIFGSNVAQPTATAGASSVAVVRPVALVFETVPKIHSVAYYVHKSSTLDKTRITIIGQMDNAWYVIAKNIEKQKNLGIPFTSADFLKFQLPLTEMHTPEYYTHHRHGGIAFPGFYVIRIRNLESYLDSYTKQLNGNLTGRMQGIIPFNSEKPQPEPYVDKAY